MKDPSVSTLAGLLDGGKSRSFGWAASLIAATTAVHEPDRWAALGTEDCTHTKDGLCPACRFLRSEFDRRWSAKADLGSCAHHVALSWASGDEVEVRSEIDAHIDGLAAFYETHQPTWVMTERTIRYATPASHAYVGQFDGIAELDCPACPPGNRCRWLIDYKTGSYHPTEATLQLAGYRCAQHVTTWEPVAGKRFRCRSDGCEIGDVHDHCGLCGQVEQHRPYARPSYYTERIDGPMPPVAHAGVVLLDPDYGGQLVELPANGDTHAVLLRLRDAWAWSAGMDRWAKEHPVGAHAPTLEGAFA